MSRMTLELGNHAIEGLDLSRTAMATRALGAACGRVIDRGAG
jgi:hypothetical protein